MNGQIRNHEQFQYTMKLCSLFLQYPDTNWLDRGEIEEILDLLENGVGKESLLSFNGYLSQHPMDLLCEQYVNTFDFNDKAPLYLTYYQLEDQKERGQALVELKEMYRKAGLEIKGNELPDYLPMLLEFLSFAPMEVLTEVVHSQVPNMDTLYKELVKNENPYRYVLEACFHSIQALLQSNKTEKIGGASS